ncbi:DUF5819 family protein [Streptomyces nigrescens]|uniref:DUF5819 family protein n=1 Tax=Streptomyces nigrescens TaxID=1920 RepID=A0A640TMF0_STRNI|nr:DUF5819 family protein [Streptomyces libani]WAT97946.1 DUF5819 family protein [Streptomyces libani subsp. libani]GFE23501.1 hypothetical protein Sliba_39540 [Streptomyces libani subsp. libani]GGV93210.1 hypothetical protein GCM10010500_28230 [Streptomyces libani subsp. libani]
MQSYGDEPRPLAALSLPSRIIIGTAACAVAVVVAVHVAMMFLHVAPSNTLSKQQGALISDYVYPEYEQNWKLFAPNPLQQNTHVQVRAQLRTEGGAARTTGWTDLTARDGRAILHNPLPSHTQQNQLRRGWELFLNTHNAQNRPVGLRGELSERYIRRIVLLRMEDEWTRSGGRIERIQVRSQTTAVRPPPWSSEKISDKPVFRVLPWWQVTADDLPEGANNQ